jgi:hypothetical protein
VEIGISTAEGWRILTAFSHEGGSPITLAPGVHHVTAAFATGLLPGDYAIDVGLHRIVGVTLDYVEQVLGFSVTKGDVDPLRNALWDVNRGFIRGETTWRHESAEVPAA